MARLIDADAFMEQFAKLQMVILLDSVEEAEIASMIGNATTIDPVKHGRWIEHKWAEEYDEKLISNYECSECESWEREMTNYCPNCGAKMDEVEECS